MSQPFAFPPFHDYPPYYTLQPVDVTRDKQCNSWGNLILNYCKHYRIFELNLNETDASDLFTNHTIDRKLSYEAKFAFFDWLVKRGNAIWKDESRQSILVLWKTLVQWADSMMEWVYTYGLEDTAMTIDDICNGEETSGTELAGVDREIIVRAISLLESKDLAKRFRGDSQDDEGVKFFKRHSS